MGYYSSVEIMDLEIKPECVQEFLQYIERNKNNKKRIFHSLLKLIGIDEDGFFTWDPSERVGKWHHGCEGFMNWLKRYCTEGKILFLSCEGDGEVWGYEFDGEGKVRELALMATGEFK
jgi:hypothetical protein